MNAIFLMKKISKGDVVRITTDKAIGVIGRVMEIDVTSDGLEIQGLKLSDELKQIDNPIEFETALFPISDIKWVFKLNLNNKIN